MKGETVVGNIYDLLNQQFHRLSELEREIMYWLAIEHEAVPLDDLQEDIVYPMAKGALLEALRSLRRRSLIESRQAAWYTNCSPALVSHKLLCGILKKILLAFFAD